MAVYCVIMLTASALFLALGISIYRGNAGLIHDYHRANIAAEELKSYCRAFARGIFTLAGALAVSGAAVFFSLAAAIVLLFAGIAAAVAVLIFVQKKYNGRIM